MVYYRETTNSTLLHRASVDIQNAFASSTFFATHLFIATWNAVGYFNLNTNKVLKYERNTVVINQFYDNNFDFVAYCQIKHYYH